jgi:hypothetical protein
MRSRDLGVQARENSLRGAPDLEEIQPQMNRMDADKDDKILPAGVAGRETPLFRISILPICVNPVHLWLLSP